MLTAQTSKIFCLIFSSFYFFYHKLVSENFLFLSLLLCSFLRILRSEDPMKTGRKYRPEILYEYVRYKRTLID